MTIYKMTYLDKFIDKLLDDKQLAYELLTNIYENSVVFFYDIDRKIAFNRNHVNYNKKDKDEEKLNNLCSLFKNTVNSLIKNHISYDYIKNDCINILENKLLTINRLNKNDIIILNLYWLLNNVDESLEWYIKEYFNDQKEISINCKWGN